MKKLHRIFVDKFTSMWIKNNTNASEKLRIVELEWQKYLVDLGVDPACPRRGPCLTWRLKPVYDENYHIEKNCVMIDNPWDPFAHTLLCMPRTLAQKILVLGLP